MNLLGLLIAAAMIAALCLAIVLAGKADKKRGADAAPEPAEKKFDERQQLARAQAGSHAHGVLLVYLLADYLLATHLGRSWAEPGVDAMLGCYFSMAVFSLECICRDAYFRVGESVRRHLWWMWLTTALYAAAIVAALALPSSRAALFSDGKVTFHTIFPALGLYDMAMTVVITKKALDARREDGEDE